MPVELTLRTYQREDIDQIIDMVEKYVPDLPNYKGIKIARDRLEYVLKHNIGGSTFQAWVLATPNQSVVGMSAAYCVQGLMSWDFIANDVFLCIENEYRSLPRANALIGAYKKWALAKKASIIIASTRSGYRPEEFQLLMKRNGFIKMGEVYHLRTDAPYMQQQLEALRQEQ